MGRLITIDGLDASGKETQSALLCAALRERGFRVRELSFPMYGEKSAVPVELYLGGALGDTSPITLALRPFQIVTLRLAGSGRLAP